MHAHTHAHTNNNKNNNTSYSGSVIDDDEVEKIVNLSVPHREMFLQTRLDDFVVLGDSS